MPSDRIELDAGKRAAARHALGFVRNRMRIGLGTGSTTEFFIEYLARRVKNENLDLRLVATSRATADLAEAEGLTLSSLDELPELDMTIDGADEVDPRLNLIKGGGGAHLKEKIVAVASSRMIVIADRSKRVTFLGAFPLPLEVTGFAWQVTRRRVLGSLNDAGLKCKEARLREAGGQPFVTDEGNLILDCHLERIEDPSGLSNLLSAVPGVVETGIFAGICDLAVFGSPDGNLVVQGRSERVT